MRVISGRFAAHVQHGLTKKILRFLSPSQGAPPTFYQFDLTFGWYPFRSESERKLKCLAKKQNTVTSDRAQKMPAKEVIIGHLRPASSPYRTSDIAL